MKGKKKGKKKGKISNKQYEQIIASFYPNTDIEKRQWADEATKQWGAKNQNGQISKKEAKNAYKKAKKKSKILVVEYLKLQKKIKAQTKTKYLAEEIYNMAVSMECFKD